VPIPVDAFEVCGMVSAERLSRAERGDPLAKGSIRRHHCASRFRSNDQTVEQDQHFILGAHKAGNLDVTSDRMEGEAHGLDLALPRDDFGAGRLAQADDALAAKPDCQIDLTREHAVSREHHFRSQTPVCGSFDR
jgi:hypothetical protein